MKRTVLFFALSCCLILSDRVASQSLQSCRASLINDTLVLENDLIARRFRWNNGQLITLSLTDKKRKQTWEWVSKDPDCAFPAIQARPAKVS
ncbi:hypothetical protein GO730_01745 [Spirosoma sp. HMF3257]|uniref:Uncharacterized protein n=1 Tax=Spirosoma telluris TaxID=2183553 RepID=A0A327NFA8_9BACT|nr:hypothetical protein [Spirosoma telluris]RAI73463.1 hypothetical protein HMF3257_01715 [Spirosoma telluris]